MGKTVYSIVLSKEVIEVIDSMAVQKGVSRSGLINHVLAEYSGLSTPEHRMRELAHAIRQRAVGGELRAEVSTAGALTLYTALGFKYNPSLRYQLDFHETGDLLGELRVSLRSQNRELLAYLGMFFELWCKLEQKHLDSPPLAELQNREERRFARKLRRPQPEADDSALGDAVAAYISVFDRCLKIYFQNLHEAGVAVRATEQAYLSALPALGLATRL